jgi:hypothetical protein
MPDRSVKRIFDLGIGQSCDAERGARHRIAQSAAQGAKESPFAPAAFFLFLCFLVRSEKRNGKENKMERKTCALSLGKAHNDGGKEQKQKKAGK